MEEYGVPDQLNTDKGREWDLCAFATRLLALRCRAARRRLHAKARRVHRYVFSKRNVRAAPPRLHPTCMQPARGLPQPPPPTASPNRLPQPPPTVLYRRV